MVKLGKIWQPENRLKTDFLSCIPFVCNTGFAPRSREGGGEWRLTPSVNFLGTTISVTISGPLAESPNDGGRSLGRPTDPHPTANLAGATPCGAEVRNPVPFPPWGPPRRPVWPSSTPTPP